MSEKRHHPILQARLCYLSHYAYFYRVFRVPLSLFWCKFTGFDVVKFDDEFIKAPDGKSTRECVVEKYGASAAALIDKLISNKE